MKAMKKRFISSLVLLVAVLLRFPAPAIAQSVAATPATPTLAERLDCLTAEIDRNRIDLHVPGLALAIVRGDEVIFARGFSVAGVALAPDTFTLQPSTEPGRGK